jgi:hypothetical protein
LNNVLTSQFRMTTRLVSADDDRELKRTIHTKCFQKIQRHPHKTTVIPPLDSTPVILFPLEGKRSRSHTPLVIGRLISFGEEQDKSQSHWWCDGKEEKFSAPNRNLISAVPPIDRVFTTGKQELMPRHEPTSTWQYYVFQSVETCGIRYCSVTGWQNFSTMYTWNCKQMLRRHRSVCR